MENKISTRNVLHQLGIGKSYSGYDYILYAVNLIAKDENVLTGITKVLYIDIAKAFHTSDTCVERNIRKVIEVIWSQSKRNHSAILKIFGERFETTKPTNKEFLELLYEYIKAHTILKKLFQTDKIICPISNEVCIAYRQLVENLVSLD